MPVRPILSLAFAIFTAISFASGQDAAPSGSSRDIDLSLLLKETQQTANVPGYAGLVWWIPTDYWVISAERSGFAEEKAKQRFAPLGKYTVVAIAVGKIGIGNIDWLPEPAIRENVVLRDADGNTYQPVQKLTGDTAGLVTIIKPVFAKHSGDDGTEHSIVVLRGLQQDGEADRRECQEAFPLC